MGDKLGASYTSCPFSRSAKLKRERAEEMIAALILRYFIPCFVCIAHSSESSSEADGVICDFIVYPFIL